MIFKETLIQSLSFAVRDSRFPPHMPRTSPLSSSVFHTASALSAPSGHLPLEGNAVKLSKILIAHASNSVCFFHPLSLLVNNKIKKLVK